MPDVGANETCLSAIERSGGTDCQELVKVFRLERATGTEAVRSQRHYLLEAGMYIGGGAVVLILLIILIVLILC